MAVSAPRARAGAWTLGTGETQILAGVTVSQASHGYDSHGAPDLPISFDKALVQVHGEYGWNDWLTLIAAPEFAHAHLAQPGLVTQHANDAAMAAGFRVRLLDRFGVLSAQLTATTAGAFDMSVSAQGAPGRQLELRLLYGSNFTLFGASGFFDAEIGQRWIAGARADEVPIDLTAGVEVRPYLKILAQSFNVLAEGNARPPYHYYRMHKLSLSVVTRMRPGLSLETGFYLAPAGQNALAEEGTLLRLWLEF